MLDRPLSKTALQQGSQCPRMLWIKYNMGWATDTSDDERDTTMFEIGDIIGASAQEFFNNTVVINTDRGFAPENYAVYADETAAYMDDPDVECIAEATFMIDDVVVFIDLLHRDYDDAGNEVWDIYEVKASGIVQPHQAQDAVWQTHIALECGVPIRATYLMHPGHGTWAFTTDEGEFEVVDMWSNWIARQAASAETADMIEYFKEMVACDEPPACECEPGCGECCHAPYQCNYTNKCRELYDEGR